MFDTKVNILYHQVVIQNLIDHHYHLIHKLGEGLFGEVYLVYDNGQYWALKLLKADLKNLDKLESLSIFKKEFLLLKEVSHPGIARIGDFGLDRTLGRYYFTSEYVNGSDFWEATQALPYTQIEELFVQTLRALQYLHQCGIVHGDLKPENVLVKTDQDTWQTKLIDFGVAVFKEQGKIMGSPTYLAPEIFMGSSSSPSTDLYAMGVMLYTVLARENPFKGEDLTETIERQKTLSPTPIHQLNPDVPIYIQHILDRLLDKNPSARYTQAATVIQDLNFLSGKHYLIETETSRYAYMPFENRLLGREKEMAHFKRMFTQVLKEQLPDANHLLILSGEIGMGKSRLLSEFKTYAQINDIPVQVIEDEQSLDIASSPNAPKLILLPKLYTFPQNSILDLLRQAIGKPILIVGEARHWDMNLPSAEVLTLPPFTREETIALLQEVFREVTLSDEFIALILGSTQGNPLFIQEITRKLLDEAWKHDNTGKWDEETIAHLTTYLQKAEVPGTLSEFLDERLNQLPDQNLFIVLALLDRPSSASELIELVGDESLPHRFLELSAQGWLVRNPDTNLWSIANPLIGKQLLAHLSPDFRAQWEEKIGMMLAKKNGKDPKALYYLSRSMNRDIARQAAEGAYEYYWQREDFATANQFLDRFLSLSEDLPLEELIRFKVIKSDCMAAMRRYEEGIAILNECLDELTMLTLDEASLKQRLECLKKLGSIYIKVGRLDDATESYQSGLTLASILKEGMAYRLYFENAKAHVKVQEGQLDTALKVFHNTWQVWQTLPPAEQSLVLNNDLGRTLYLMAKYPESRDQLYQEVAFYEREQNFFLQARSHYHLADTYMALRNFDDAIVHYEKGIDIAKAHHAHELLIRLYNGLGNVYQLSQNIEKSIEAYEKALRYTRNMQENPAMAGILTNLGILYHRTAKKYDAFSHLTCAIHLINQLPTRRAYELQCLARSHLELGDYYLKAKDSKKAEGHLRDALNLCTTHKGIESLLPWVLERLIRATLETAPHSEELPDWFKLWDKVEPGIKDDPENSYHALHDQWLDKHLVDSPFRKKRTDTVEDVTRTLDGFTTTTYTDTFDDLDFEAEVSDVTANLETGAAPNGSAGVLSWKEFEAAYIAQTLFQNRFHISHTARSLHLTRTTLYRKIASYRLEQVSPLSFSINIPLAVPLGLSLKRALFLYLSSVMQTGKVDHHTTQVLGVSRARVDRLLNRGKEAGWDKLLQ